VALLLGAVAVLAAWLPAWRAASVSPLEAMESQ
jgi:ABC-type lipoprotein release transport system permease subunit